MTTWITEHYGDFRLKQGVSQPLRGYMLSTASTSFTPGAGCHYIRVVADVKAFLQMSTAGSTGTTLTSTNPGVVLIGANAPPEYFSISTSVNLFASST